MNSITTCIRNCELLSGLPENEIEQLLDQFSFRTVKKNTIILTVGDDTDSVFIIDSGRVRAFRENDEGRQITLNTLRAGDIFGHLASLAEAPRSASVETIETSRLLTLPKKGFISLLESHPETAIKITREFAQMVNIMSDHVTEIALLDVYGRIVRFIERSSTENSEGKMTMQGFTHQELANNVGSSREMVSRIISGLKKGNYISTSPENHTIIVERKLPSGW